MTDATILRGAPEHLPASAIAVVVDVLRAFTVTHLLFARGADHIVLCTDVVDAFDKRAADPSALLIGEVDGHPIPGFELPNSPAAVAHCELAGRRVILRTTRGVPAVHAAQAARALFVCGFTNAVQTAEAIRARRLKRDDVIVIASHPSSDDDFACAEYVAALADGIVPPSPRDVVRRIRESSSAWKFLDPSQPEFDPRDLDLACAPSSEHFAVGLTRRNPLTLGKVPL